MLKIESTQKAHTMKQFSVEITLNEKSANINQIENAIDQIFLNLKIGNTELGINSKLSFVVFEILLSILTNYY